mmetsp:Transcript_635/g.844  ORF Transcript_635/g.844 Transcript_635/m.844 type:complete len:888 (+) Transcript_635:131-2794(+)
MNRISRLSSRQAAAAKLFTFSTRGVATRALPSTTSQPFLSSLTGGEAALPFQIPKDSWLRNGIGNTPLIKVENNIWAKLEGHNPGGSVKDRTLTSIVFSMFREGKLAVKGDTLVLVTSGSAGASLVAMSEALKAVPDLDLNVVVVMPKAYAHKPVPAEIIAMPCTRVFDCDPNGLIETIANGSTGTNVLLMEGVFMDVLAETKTIAAGQNWKMLDQHFDNNSMDGHRSTALELVEQFPGVTDVICATGTGATAAGLVKHLPARVKVHSRPALSGSIDGLSDVNRYGNFCDTTKLKGYDTCIFDATVANNTLAWLKSAYNVDAGPSSGACYWLAKEIRDENPNAQIVFICADGKIAPKPQESFHVTMNNKKNPACTPWPLESSVEGENQSAFGFASHSAFGRYGNRPRHTCLGQISAGSIFSRRFSTSSRNFSTSSESCFDKPPSDVTLIDNIVIGGGPVGASAAWFLAENEKADGKSILMVHDPQNKGAHEDWSRLARLSFDGPWDEMVLSRHAVSLLDMADEIRSYSSGEPVVPLRPGMLFLASPGTNLAIACEHGEAEFGDDQFIRRDLSELEDLYPGNSFNLPPETLAWSHPTGLCVSPLELASVGRGVAQSYGVDIRAARASVDMSPAGDNLIRVTLSTGEVFDTRNCFVFAGAQGKKMLSDSLARHASNAPLQMPEMEETYITSISTVRYKHRNHPANPVEGSGHVPPPITLGQLEIPDLCAHQANFSVVAEEYGDVLKTRLSGAAGTETIDTVADLYKSNEDQHARDEEMRETYGKFFGTLFPYLETEKPLDFNRCVTYRSHNSNFSGTSLLHKKIGDGATASNLMITPGCFGVGVKFGPALGQAAAAYTYGDELEKGMNVFSSGDDALQVSPTDRIERAW